ncbi:MAG TPA: dehydrogenase [Methanosarcinales archaeon]|nr:dehydrogenase [Methanosarcinales archaeon]
MEQISGTGRVISILTALLLLAALLLAIVSVAGLGPFVPGTLPESVPIDYTVWEDGSKDASGIEHVGGLLFTKYVIPFEVLALVLLAALLGSLYMAKKEEE